MLIHFELPVVRFAQEAALQNDLSELIELDACVDATKTARELREASRTTGRRRLHAFGEAGASTALAAFAGEVEAGRCHAHHAVVYGCGLASLPPQALLTSWAFQSLSAVCLASPKLLRIGQNAAQRILTMSLLYMEKRVDLSMSVPRDDLGWFDPVIEIASMQHETAYERLFIS
jgi:urease accessory protein